MVKIPSFQQRIKKIPNTMHIAHHLLGKKIVFHISYTLVLFVLLCNWNKLNDSKIKLTVKTRFYYSAINSTFPLRLKRISWRRRKKSLHWELHKNNALVCENTIRCLWYVRIVKISFALNVSKKTTRITTGTLLHQQPPWVKEDSISHWLRLKRTFNSWMRR